MGRRDEGLRLAVAGWGGRAQGGDRGGMGEAWWRSVGRQGTGRHNRSHPRLERHVQLGEQLRPVLAADDRLDRLTPRLRLQRHFVRLPDSIGSPPAALVSSSSSLEMTSAA